MVMVTGTTYEIHFNGINLQWIYSHSKSDDTMTFHFNNGVFPSFDVSGLVLAGADRDQNGKIIPQPIPGDELHAMLVRILADYVIENVGDKL